MYRGPDRKLNRWRGYNYRFPGLYFVTICTHGRQIWFGGVKNYEMELNQIGGVVEKQMLWLHNHFPSVRLDEHIVMPNHVHLILEMNNNFDDKKERYIDKPVKIVGTGRDGKIFDDINTVGNNRANDGTNGKTVGTGLDLSLQNCQSLSHIIGALKTTSSKLIHQIGHADFAWHRSFHDRIIRDEEELSRIRDYIISNPAKWSESKNNPINFK